MFTYRINRSWHSEALIVTVSDEYFGPETIIFTAEELLKFANDLKAVALGEAEERHSEHA